MRKWVIREVPANVPQTQLVAKSSNRLVALKGREVRELGDGLVDRLQSLNGTQFYMLRV